MQKPSKAIKNKFVSIVLISFFVFGLFTFNTFEGGSCAGVTWSYNPSTKTATANGTGTTNFSELVQADIDGGWGGIFTADATGTQIICTGKIIIGDGTNACVFLDNDKQITFITTGLITANWQRIIEVKSNSTLTLGSLDNAGTKSTSKGCSLLRIDNVTYYAYLIDITGSTGTVNLYSCQISYNYTSTGYPHAYFGSTMLGSHTASGTFRLYNSVLSGVNIRHTGSNIDVFRLNSGRGYYAFMAGGTINDVSIMFSSWAISLQTNVAQTFFNIKTYATDNQGIYANSITTDKFLIDCVFDKWTVSWVGSNTGKIFRQYTFNLNVLNGEITDFVEGATVQLWKDSNLVYEGTTNSSGMIPTQTLTYGYYQQSTGNTIQNASSPYYLVVTHPDWQTYVSRFYITEPLRLTVSMQEPTYTGYTEAEKSDYTTIILFVISSILCIMGLALTVPLLPLISLTISVINIIFLSEPTIFNILLIILNVTFTVIALVRAKTKNN